MAFALLDIRSISLFTLVSVVSRPTRVAAEGILRHKGFSLLCNSVLNSVSVKKVDIYFYFPA